MKLDGSDLPISTDSDDLVAALDRFANDFLAARDGAAAIFALAASHPDCALVQIYAAAMYVYAQSTASFTAGAAPLLARVEGGPLHEREALLAGAVRAAIGADYERAIEHCEAIAARWPRDVVSAKFGEFMFYLAPDYARHRRFMETIAAANPENSHVGAMLAFAFEMTGDYTAAERTAEAALAREPATPWAHHALAHLYLNQGRIDEGIARLEGYAPSWQRHVRTMRCHNGWHLALLYLADLRLDAARAQFRAQIWGFEPDNVQEHIDAISFLWRLDLAGHRADAEWQAIAPHIVERAREEVFPFLSAHYAYALARAGEVDAAHDAARALAAFAARQSGRARHVWGALGLPLVEGCIASAAGKYGRCATLLEPILGESACVGGSDAQNDLFRQTYVDALIHTGRGREARAAVEQRLGGRRPTALDADWLRRC